MRNLKKFLALALAMMMVFSLFVTVNAADSKFTDLETVTDERLLEGIEVLVSMGALQGYDDGTFQPNKVVTRAEFAAMMYRIHNGDPNDEHVADYVEYGAQFDDVGTDHWYSGHVGYCYKNGLLNGTGEHTYSPKANIKAVDVVLSWMRTLGWDAGGEYQDQYYNATAILTKAQKIGLLVNDGKGEDDTGVGNTKGMAFREITDTYATRALVARLAFDSFFCMPVTVHKDLNGNLQYKPAGATQAEIKLGLTMVYNPESVDAKEQDAAKKAWDAIPEADKVSPYGRPAPSFVLVKEDGTVVYAAWPEALGTYVVNKSSVDTVEGLVGDKKLGSTGSKAVLTYADDLDKKTVALGDVVELYVDSDKQLIAAPVYHYELGAILSVTEVDEDEDADAIEAGASYKVEVKLGGTEYTGYDINLNGFDPDTYVEGAKVAVACWEYDGETYPCYYGDVEWAENGTTFSLTFVVAETYVVDALPGKITAKPSAGTTITVDGTSHPISAGYAEVVKKITVGTEQNFYLDKNGVIIASKDIEEDETPAEIGDVFYVIGEYTVNTPNSLGQPIYKTYLYVVYADGTTGSVLINADAGKANPDASDYTKEENSAKLYTAGKANSKTGAYTPKEWEPDEETYFSGTIKKSSTLKADNKSVKNEWISFGEDYKGVLRLNASTKYIVITENDDLDLVTIDIIEGGIDVATTGKAYPVIATKVTGNYVASVVFVADKLDDASAGSDGMVYVYDASEWDEVEGGFAVKAYDMTGEEITITIAAKVADETLKISVPDEGEKTKDVELTAGFYTYVEEKNVCTLTPADEAKLPGEGVSDNKKGTISDKFYSYFDEEVTLLHDGAGDEVITVDEDTVIKGLSKSSAANEYKKDVGTLKQMLDAYNAGFDVSLDIYVDKDGVAQFIVVTGTTDLNEATDGTITIDTQPSKADVENGVDTGEVSVVASASNGRAVTYQWYITEKDTVTKDTPDEADVPISSGTKAKLTLDRETYGDEEEKAVSVYCIVSAVGCADKATNIVKVTFKVE